MLIKNNKNNTVQAFWIAMGSLAAFGFSIVSAAILSRYLSKSDYGTYRQILYVYTSLLVIFSVGLPKAFAYFLPRVDMTEGRSLIRKMTLIFLLLGFVFSVLLFFGSPIIAAVLKNPELEIGLKYFSPVPMLMLPTMGIEGIYSTLKKTYVIAIYTIVTRIGMLLFIALPVLFYKNDYQVAVIGFVVSSFLAFILALYLKHKPFVKILSVKTKVSYKEIFGFSLPLMYASIWGVLIASADQFFISRYFGKTVFADFANGSLQLPFVLMVSGATSTVLQPIFSRIVNEGGKASDMLPIWKSTLAKSAIIIYPLVLFFWAFAENIMVLLYGGLYKDSAGFFRIMSLYNLFNIIVFAPAILAFGATKFYSKVHFFIAISIWVSQYIVIKIFPNPYLISAISVFCRSLIVFIMCNYIAKKFQVRFIDLFPLKIILKIIVSCSIILIMLKLLIYYIPVSFNPFLLLILAMIAYGILILGSSTIIKIDYISIFKPLILRSKK